MQPTKEWVNKVNFSSFELKTRFQIRVRVIIARKAKHIDHTTMFTYSHANTPLSQSERAYYLSYFIKSYNRYPVIVNNLCGIFLEISNQHSVNSGVFKCSITFSGDISYLFKIYIPFLASTAEQITSPPSKCQINRY